MNSINHLVRPNIAALQPYSSARDEYSGSAKVFLDANENPFGTLNRYPDPRQQELKVKLAEVKGVPAGQIFIGNGSDELIDLAFRIFCEPNIDKALTFSPTYGMYQVSAGINAIALEHASLTKSFDLDWEIIQDKATDRAIKLVFLCNPNNPTGNSFSHSEIKKLCNLFNALVIVDEAYIDFSDNSSALELINNIPNLLVMQTFSKAWGLAGARVGMGFAQKEIINLFNKVKPPYNVSELNQQAALKALKNIEEFKKNRALILKEKQRLIKELPKLNQVIKVYPSDTNFLLVEFKDADSWYSKLVNQKIITRNRNKLVANCLRITVGSIDENTTLLNALKA